MKLELRQVLRLADCLVRLTADSSVHLLVEMWVACSEKKLAEYWADLRAGMLAELMVGAMVEKKAGRLVALWVYNWVPQLVVQKGVHLAGLMASLWVALRGHNSVGGRAAQKACPRVEQLACSTAVWWAKRWVDSWESLLVVLLVDELVA